MLPYPVAPRRVRARLVAAAVASVSLGLPLALGSAADGAPAPAASATPASATAASATAASATAASLTSTAWPPRVTAGQPTGLVVTLAPAAAGRDVVVQQKVDGAWTDLGTVTTDARGQAYQALDTSDATTSEPVTLLYRARAAATEASPALTSPSASVRVNAHTDCRPTVSPIDPDATGEAVCLAARLDSWRDTRFMAAGQQLNVSSSEYAAPLTALDDPVGVVGFDLEELRKAGSYEYPFADAVIDDLLQRAADGAVLVASWHAPNPFYDDPDAHPATDRSKHDLSKVLDRTSPVGQRFWASYDEVLDLLARFGTGDEGRYPWAAVVFRPMHEANGAFFWWGKPDPKVYRKLWSRMQDEAMSRGVHNLLWGWSFNVDTVGVTDPTTLAPQRMDLAGLDSYDPEKVPRRATRKEAKRIRADHLDLSGYDAVAALPQVPRMAITETGPHGSADGSWNPAVLTRTVQAAGVRPVWAMLWFDDAEADYDQAGLKQISSLTGGPAWLHRCWTGLCSLR